MSADLVPFDFSGQQVRVITDEQGEPWFVAADIARILGYRMASDMTRRLDNEDMGTRSVRTPGGDQHLTVITEAGLYVAILGSQVDGARAFKRWVTRDVLPAIRRTGSYGAAPALPDITTPQGVLEMAEQFAATARALVASQEKVAELAPRAEVADRILDATTDMSVADAAKTLTRAGLEIGERRLFADLAARGWIFRQRSDNRWRAYQVAISRGWISVLPKSHYHPQTGELVLDPPQIRVTPKGLQKLLGQVPVPA